VGEPFETLLLLLADGRVTEAEARAVIENAELGLILDDELLEAASEDEDGLLGATPTFQLQIHVADIVITCMPQDFAYLLRRTIEQPETLGITPTSSTGICRIAARKMQSTPVAYSFASAEAYWLETLGDREAAKQAWAPYEWMNDGEWTPHEGDTLFLEPPIGAAAWAEGTEELAAMVEQGRRERQPDLLYHSLRNVALAYAASGRLEEAQTAFEEAVRLAPEQISTAAMLVLVGDTLRVAAAADDSTAVHIAVGRLDELADATPPYVGAAALFARTARLLYAVSEPHAAFRCVSRIADCLR
jgi:hypothetical protein